MRAALAILAAGTLLAGCSGRYDGSWLVFYSLASDSENPENPQIGVEYRTLANLYRTQDEIVFDFAGTLLTGTRDGSDFTASYEQGVQYLDMDCDTYQESSSVEIEGTFTDDLGFDATLTQTYTEVIQGCSWTDDESTQQVKVYDLTGMMLDAAPGAHGSASMAWGYFNVPGVY